MNRATLVQIYAATIEALGRWESRIRVNRVLAADARPGRGALTIEAAYVRMAGAPLLDGNRGTHERISRDRSVRLAPPSVIEALTPSRSFRPRSRIREAATPSFFAVTEADPAYKILEVAAYRELLIPSVKRRTKTEKE